MDEKDLIRFYFGAFWNNRNRKYLILEGKIKREDFEERKNFTGAQPK